MIIAHHRKAGDKLKATLEAKVVHLSSLAPKHKKMLDQLEGAKDKKFDMQAQDGGKWACSEPMPVRAKISLWSALPRKRFRVALAVSYHAFLGCS
jgi:hypothetical protein